MAGFARWCFLHRRAVLAAWLIALIGFFAAGRLAGSAYSNSFSLPGTDSARALDEPHPLLSGSREVQGGRDGKIV